MKNSVKPLEVFDKELKERFPNNQIEILSYTKASGPITYKCLQCGKVYKKTRANHLFENKTLCQQCYTARTSKFREESMKKLIESGFDILDNTNKTTSEKFHIRCNNCGREYDYRLQKTSGDKITCRFCGKNGSPVDKEEMERRLEEKHLEDFKILDYKNFTHSMKIQHKCGYVFSQLPFNFLKSGNCPKCNPKRSKGETKIMNWLNDKQIEYIEQYTPSELEGLSYDFYLEAYNLLIEYQGIQHYEPVEHFGGEEKFIIQLDRDRRKREYAKKEGIKLLEISYKNFSEIEQILEGSTTIPHGSRGKRLEAESAQQGR